MITIIIRSCNQCVLSKNCVLQVLTFWEKQTVLQCLKRHIIYMTSDSTREKVFYMEQDFPENQKRNLHAKQLAKRLVSPCIWKRENFVYKYFGYYFLLQWQKRTPSFLEFLLPWIKYPEKLSGERPKQRTTAFTWKCAILLMFTKKVTCNILKN